MMALAWRTAVRAFSGSGRIRGRMVRLGQKLLRVLIGVQVAAAAAPHPELCRQVGVVKVDHAVGKGAVIGSALPAADGAAVEGALLRGAVPVLWVGHMVAGKQLWVFLHGPDGPVKGLPGHGDRRLFAEDEDQAVDGFIFPGSAGAEIEDGSRLFPGKIRHRGEPVDVLLGKKIGKCGNCLT